MNRINILKIPFSFGGIDDAIYPVVLRDERHMVLVDCGYVGFLKEIERAMENEGMHCKDLTHVFITHHDHDHIGTLSALKRTYPQIRVVTSRAEEPYINGECKSLRLVQAEAMQPLLPPERQAFGKAFCEMLAKVQPVSVDDLVQNDECLPWCGGLCRCRNAGAYQRAYFALSASQSNHDCRGCGGTGRTNADHCQPAVCAGHHKGETIAEFDHPLKGEANHLLPWRRYGTYLANNRCFE